MWHWLREKRHQAVRSSCPSPEGLDKTNSQSMNAKEMELAITRSTLANLWSLGGLAACYSARQFQFEEATAGLSVPLCNVSGSVHGLEEEFWLWIKHMSGYACQESKWDMLLCETVASSMLLHNQLYTRSAGCKHWCVSSCQPCIPNFFIHHPVQEPCWSFHWSLKEFLLYGWIKFRWLPLAMVLAIDWIIYQIMIINV